ncbi:MAG: molybdopterin-synthase adenylyltransferase MoeB [Verrucomicrobiota bacterium]
MRTLPPPETFTEIPLSEAERERYLRQTSLPGFGEAGQEALRSARVLCIGAGGLGCPALTYLAAAGVGTLGIVDPDQVERSNLHRQPLHGENDLGQRKTDSAARQLRAINPHVEVKTHAIPFTVENAAELLSDYDLLLDGTDNFPTRYLSNDAAFFAGKPNVYGSVFRFEGSVSLFDPHRGGPCYRCLFPEPPEEGSVPNCAEGGVLGVLPGIIGSLQALEAIKWLTGLGDSLRGRLLHFDASTMKFRTLALRADPSCPLCGEAPTLKRLQAVQLPCALGLGELSPEELETQQKLDPTLQLIDVREEREFLQGHIPGARLLPLSQLLQRLGEIDRQRPVYLHCQKGGRSAQAGRLLLDQGFSPVTHLVGGYQAWLSSQS